MPPSPLDAAPAPMAEAAGTIVTFTVDRLAYPASPPKSRTKTRGPDMGSHGITDRVAIVGMGCTRFTEHWDKGVDELLIDATDEAFASAGVTKDDVDAYWLGTAQSGMSGLTLAKPLRLENKPVYPGREHGCNCAARPRRSGAFRRTGSGRWRLALGQADCLSA